MDGEFLRLFDGRCRENDGAWGVEGVYRGGTVTEFGGKLLAH